jgi:uncharacterized small protein (DUF1192 family)
MNVRFVLGKVHKLVPQRVLKDTMTLLGEFFSRLELPLGSPQPEYTFVLVNRKQCKMRQPKDSCRFVRFERNQLLFKVKPGDNSTAWEWIVTPDSALLPLLQTVLQTETEAEAEEGEPSQLSDHAASPPVPPVSPLMHEVPSEIQAVGAAVVSVAVTAPAAAEAAVAVLPIGEDRLLDRYRALQAQAQAWLGLDGEINSKLTELQRLEDRMNLLRQEITALEDKHKADTAGSDAASKMKQLWTLIGG